MPLEEHLRRHVGGVWHPSGTCRMGSAQDRMAVVTPDARLRGLVGLRVCDGSIMPHIPCANTNVPILMIAEKVADTVRREAQ
ncbi:GMC oxidoreductase [Pseudoroseomonas wenyumeiae]|uniref:GMC oxidoreductase n=1 Tax=Teichococcus wenyumeiae TaxID=2478470 RepID=UPI002277986E|nr:GMC oxidoreductase [Pseudoroseomonas wenyumeiae]